MNICQSIKMDWSIDPSIKIQSRAETHFQIEFVSFCRCLSNYEIMNENNLKNSTFLTNPVQYNI